MNRSNASPPCPGRFAVLITVLLAAGCGGSDNVAPSPPPQAAFIALGQLAGYTASRATAVSAGGEVVVGTASTATGEQQGFRWTASGGQAGVGFTQGGTWSTAVAVSADGSIVLGNGDGTAVPGTVAGPFRWSAGNGAVRMAVPAGVRLCSGAGISGDGAVVGGTCLTVNVEAFRWSGDDLPTGLGQSGGGSNRSSNATAVSSDGSTVVGAGHPMLTGAVIWRGTVAAVIGMLPGDVSAVATAASADGAVIVGNSSDVSGVTRAFAWTAQSGMAPLGAAPAGVVGTSATGISGDGARVVGWGRAGNGDTALLWDRGRGWRRLDIALAEEFRTAVPGWQLSRATAVSTNGRSIVGDGVNPNGQVEGWLVRLPD